MRCVDSDARWQAQNAGQSQSERVESVEKEHDRSGPSQSSLKAAESLSALLALFGCGRRPGHKEELPKEMEGLTKAIMAVLPSRFGNSNRKRPCFGRGDHGSNISFGVVSNWILFVHFRGLIRSFGSLRRDNK